MIAIANDVATNGIDVSAIPHELKVRAQWVLWRQESRNGKPTKVPYRTDARMAKANDPATWTTFDSAWAVYCHPTSQYSGIGFVFARDDPYCGVDLDLCLSPDGALTDWAKSALDLVNSYTEVSPSGLGLKVIAKGQLPLSQEDTGATFAGFEPAYSAADKRAEIALWNNRRYFTLTGLVYDGRHQIRDCQSGLDQLYELHCDGRRAVRPKLKVVKGLSADPSDGLSRQALRAMRCATKNMADGGDGSKRLFTVACRAVGHGLGESEAVATIRAYERERPFPREYSDEDIVARLRDAQRTVASASEVDRRIQVIVDADEARVVHEALTAIADDRDLFVRGGVLVHVTRAWRAKPSSAPARHAERPIIRPIEAGYLRTVLARNIAFVKGKGSDDNEDLVPIHVPDFVTRAVHACGSWGNPVIEAVTQTPFITASGEIVTQAGFNKETGVFLQSGLAVDVAEDVDQPAASAAAGVVLDVFYDFPFATPCHRSATLAAVLTEFAKHSYQGPTPATVVDSNVRGAGKGKLVSTIHGIQTGRPAEIATLPSANEELQKVITAMAIAGDSIVVFDNVDTAIGGSHLDAVLTTTVWQGRVLGVSRTFRGPFRPSWYFTGNNLRFRGDMPRRVLPIRLESPLEHPEERDGFKYPDVVGHAIATRSQLASACLTILRGFLQAGQPQAPLTTFGSFEGWSSLVRQAVVWCGLPDPCEGSRQLARDSDEKTEALGAIIANWDHVDPDDRGVTAGDLRTKVQGNEELRAAWCELCDCKEEDLSARKLGWALRRYRGRVVAGCCLDERGSDMHTRTKLWRRLRPR